MLGHERHHLPSHLQRGHVPVQIDPVQALDVQPDMPLEQLTDRHRRTHPPSVTKPDAPDQPRPLAVRGEASLGGRCESRASGSALTCTFACVRAQFWTLFSGLPAVHTVTGVLSPYGGTIVDHSSQRTLLVTGAAGFIGL